MIIHSRREFTLFSVERFKSLNVRSIESALIINDLNGRRRDAWRFLLLAFFLTGWTVTLSGQNTPDTVVTNQQAVSTNVPAGVDTNFPFIVPFTNQLQTPPVVQPVIQPLQQPALGPATVGQPQPQAPVMGTSALATGPAPPLPIESNAPIPLGGAFTVRPHLIYSFLFGNGIDSIPGQQSKTIVNTVTPGFLLDIGKYWNINYSPSFAFYSSSQFKNTVDENVALHGGWTNESWILSLTQSYNKSTDPLIETGLQTEQDAYSTLLNATHQMGSDWSYSLGLDQNFRFTELFTDLHEWETQDWLNYQASQHIGLGIGTVIGYDKEDPGSDMPFEQLNGRFTFNPNTNLSLSLTGGVEDRQFLGPSAAPLISPIFSGLLSYQIFRPTQLSLSGSRTVMPSFFANQVIVETTVGATIRQEITSKFFLDLNAGYSSEPETAIVPAPLPQYYLGTPPRSTLQEVRSDDITTYRVSLLYVPSPRLTTSVFYQISEDSSGQANYSFVSHQVGFTLTYNY